MWRGRERRTGGGRGRRGGGDSDGAGGPQARRGRGSRSHLLFFSSRGGHTEYWRDWSSDVCSSDLEMVEVPAVGGRPPRQLSRQILCDILQPRAEEVLSHVADEIREAGWEGQLSSGVVLTGGGALLDGMVEIAEQVFDAPVRLGYPERDRFGGLRSEEPTSELQSPQ